MTACGRQSGSTPTKRAAASGPWNLYWLDSRSWWEWESAGSTTTTTFRRARRNEKRLRRRSRSATSHGLALVVHTREAWEDTFAVLRSEGVPPRTVFHCFTGGPAEARTCLQLGAWLSFSGIVTFKNAGEVREAAVLCPLDRLLVETDSPYLAPVPYRGRQNSPAFVPLVGAAVAAAKGVDVALVEAASWDGAAEVFALER